jgi:hypothetical protein
MLLYHLEFLFNCCIVVTLIVTICTTVAYSVNSRRAEDDPKRRNYHPLAILLAPITFPVFAVFYISIFTLRVITYGVFMVLFIIAMLIIRKPFILEWLKKNATIIGDLLLEANTLLIRIFLRPLAGPRGSA